MENKRKHFNVLALEYFEDRSEKNFARLYNELRNVGMATRAGLTVEDQDFETIINDLALKLQRDYDEVYQSKKSLLSYCIVAFKSKFYSLLPKYNKRVLASSLMFEDESSESSVFESLVSLDNPVNEIDIEMFATVSNDSNKKLSLFYEILEEEYPEEKDLMKEIFSPREDIETNNSFVWKSPAEVISNTNFDGGKTAISARRTRAIQKIRTKMNEKLKIHEFADHVCDDLDVEDSYGTKWSVRNRKVVRKEFETKDGCTMIIEEENGIQKIQKKWQNGKIKEEGVRAGNKRTGIWLFYYENGKLEGKIDYDNDMRFVLFDEEGFGENMGKLK